MPAITPDLRAAAAALLVVAAACGDPTAASGPRIEFALRTIDGASVPIRSDGHANGRGFAVVGGALSFDGFSDGAGSVALARTSVATDANGASVYETRVAPGTFMRRGDTVQVAFGATRREVYMLEHAGRTLRTIATSGCDAPPDIVCPDILSVSVYERVD